MKQLLIKKGKAFTGELPAPMVGEDNVLVQVGYSCISVGTEMVMSTDCVGRHRGNMKHAKWILMLKQIENSVSKL